jgi:hypothetical protein
MLLLWLRQISLNFDAHYKEASHLGAVDARYVTALSLFAALSAIASLVNIADFGETVRIILTCSAAAASIVVVFANNMRDRHKFEEKGFRNKQTAEQYDDLSAYIQSTILLDEKPDPAMFLRIVMDRFRLIKQFGPDLPDDFASIAGLPNLILMKDAQKRKEAAGGTGAVEDVDFIKEGDASILGGNTPQGSPVTAVPRSASVPDIREVEELREVVVEGEDSRDNIPIETLGIPRSMAARDYSNIESDEEDSMELIQQMRLCDPEAKHSLAPAPRRLAEASLVAETSQMLDDMKPNPLANRVGSVEYIGPKTVVVESAPSKRRRRRKSTPKTKTLLSLNRVTPSSPRSKEPPKTKKEKLDEQMEKKMNMLKMDTLR